MIVFTIINAFGRLVLTLAVIVILGAFREQLNIWQRIGLGMAGGGSFLSVPVIFSPYSTPFEGWATSLVTWGVLLFFAATARRLRRHYKANAEQVRRSKEHLKQRGVL